MVRVPTPPTASRPLRRAAGEIGGGVLVLVLLGSLLAGRPAAAQEDRSFRSEEQVTAVDLAIALDPPRTFKPSTRPPGAADVRIEVDGRTLPAVAVDPAPANRGDAPWTVLLYFDLALSDRSQTSWAAELLTHHLDELTRLGTVELVVADPEPRTVVSPTRDTASLDAVLSRMVFFPEAEDALVEARLTSGRDEADSQDVEEHGDRTGSTEAEAKTPAAPSPTSLERGLVQDRLDRLVLTAIDRSADAEPRRAVFVASGGYEADGGDGPLLRATDRAANTLAAYGWSVLPLLEHPPSGTVPGFRIGKWRFSKPAPGPALRAILVTATHEQERDPERAAAFLELAKARRAQGELEGAGRAARQAMTHFADDPRTASQQGEALLLLAEVYDAQGRTQLARRTYLRAATRDPKSLAHHPEVLAAVQRPEVAFQRLAAATLGHVVRSRDDWKPALATLDRRGLVTVQLSGLPDGELHAARVIRLDAGPPIGSVRWLRFGTPQEVVAARARSLLDDLPQAGELPVTATLLAARHEATDGSSLALRADPSVLAKIPRTAILRATLAVPGDEGETRIIPFAPEPLDPAPTSPWGWTLRRPIQAAGRVEWGVVVVDELVGGSWGAALAQTEPGDPDSR